MSQRRLHFRRGPGVVLSVQAIPVQVVRRLTRELDAGAAAIDGAGLAALLFLADVVTADGGAFVGASERAIRERTLVLTELRILFACCLAELQLETGHYFALRLFLARAQVFAVSAIVRNAVRSATERVLDGRLADAVAAGSDAVACAGQGVFYWRVAYLVAAFGRCLAFAATGSALTALTALTAGSADSALAADSAVAAGSARSAVRVTALAGLAFFAYLVAALRYRWAIAAIVAATVFAIVAYLVVVARRWRWLAALLALLHGAGD